MAAAPRSTTQAVAAGSPTWPEPGEEPRAAAVPPAAAATLSEDMVTNTCARAVGGAYRERAAKVAVTNGAFETPVNAKATSASG